MVNETCEKKIKFNKINIGRIQTQVYHVEIANF